MRIILAGHFGFPTGSAGASRMRHIALGLSELGHEVFAISLVPGQVVPAGVWQRLAGGVSYCSSAGPERRFARHRLIRRVSWRWADLARTADHTTKLIGELMPVDVMIGYSKMFFPFGRVVATSRRMGVVVAQAVDEWQDPGGYPHGRLNPLYWNDVLANKLQLPKSDGIIAISGYLARHFAAAGVPTVTIPAIIDCSDNSWGNAEPTGNAVFQLTYLGPMSQRDGPLLMLEAVRRVLLAGHAIHFNVAGSSSPGGLSAQAQDRAQADPVLRDRVSFLGRISDQGVRDLLVGSDALLFTRLSGQPGQAAFPTRLPEYLMTSRPVISSRISDIPLYLEDRRDAILIQPDSDQSLAEGIIRLLAMPDRGTAIGLNGRQRCRECFDYRSRCVQIADFLTGLRAAAWARVAG